MRSWGGCEGGEAGSRKGVLTPLFPHRRAFPKAGRRWPGTWVSLCFPAAVSAWSVFRPCFGLISGISTGNTRHGCQGVASGISFLRLVCICTLIVVQPHSPLQDRKKRQGNCERISSSNHYKSISVYNVVILITYNKSNPQRDLITILYFMFCTWICILHFKKKILPHNCIKTALPRLLIR